MSDSDDVAPWPDPEARERARRFGRRLGIPPKHDELVVRALTHRSMAESAPLGDNERLEFLGDSVLALLVNDYLYRTYPDDPEGVLTKLKARYVSEPSLAHAAAHLELGTLLAIAPADEVAGARERPSILSDAFEALLAAIYLSSGLEAARQFVHRELITRVDPTHLWDHKSRLQELFQERERVTPVYRTVSEEGPAHNRTFECEVLVDERPIGRGTGRSKKIAEQAAAADALGRVEDEEPATGD